MSLYALSTLSDFRQSYFSFSLSTDYGVSVCSACKNGDSVVKGPSGVRRSFDS